MRYRGGGGDGGMGKRGRGEGEEEREEDTGWTGKGAGGSGKEGVQGVGVWASHWPPLLLPGSGFLSMPSLRQKRTLNLINVCCQFWDSIPCHISGLRGEWFSNNCAIVVVQVWHYLHSSSCYNLGHKSWNISLFSWNLIFVFICPSYPPPMQYWFYMNNAFWVLTSRDLVSDGFLWCPKDLELGL